jgi:hypothetical protein
MGLNLRLAFALLLPAMLVCAQGRRHPGPPSYLAIERLNRMPEQERQKLLDKLPPKRREMMERRLARYNQMPARGRERLKQEFDQFEGLPPEKKARVRELFRSFRDLPEDRRASVRRSYQSLRGLSEEERNRRLASEEFRSNFNEREQGLIQELSGLMAVPPRSP